MGSSSANGAANGELERSSTAPWDNDTGESADSTNAQATQGTTKHSSSDRSKVWMLLDRSGSMSGLERAVVNGANRFISEQAELPGKCKLTIAQFDSQEPFEVVVDAVSVHKASPLSRDQYQPRAATPLFDAVGALIGRADQRIKNRRKAGKKLEDQTVVIVTDGLENASSDFSVDDVHRLISSWREQGWAFVFMGANQDSYFEGARMGFDERSVQNYEASDRGVDAAFASVSRAYSERRVMAAPEREASSDDYFGGVREAEDEMHRRSS